MNIRKILISMLAACAIAQNAATSMAAKTVTSAEEYVRTHCLLPDAVHPILLVKSGQGLNGKKLPASVFGEMTDYSGPECELIWKRDFAKAESEAALACCNEAFLKNDRQLLRLLDKPLDIKAPRNPIARLINQEDWIYLFGAIQVPVKLVLINKLCVYAFIDNSEKFPKNYKAERIDEEWLSMPHPILNVYVGTALPRLKKLDPIVYRKLNNPDIAAIDKKCGHFRIAESQAAQSFCDFAIGLTDKDAQFYFGRPLYKGCAAPGWKWCKPLVTTWFYELGASAVPVRLTTERGKCTAAEILDTEEVDLYWRWRKNQIIDFAKGKTIEQVIAHEGIPNEVSDNSYETKLTEGEKISYVDYYFTRFSKVILQFKNGICTEAEVDIIRHRH